MPIPDCTAPANSIAPVWKMAFNLDVIPANGAKIVKIGKNQIAVFLRDGLVYACNNRCPHEGFPLKEGTLSDACTLTCNWHNWKFDLKTGENLYGGDSLRVFPVSIHDDVIWIDVSSPSPDVLIADALTNLRESFDRHEYDRMARELARMDKAGGDPLDALRSTIAWTHEHFEFGMGSTHAFAAAADWLSLRDRHRGGGARDLMPIHESIAYFAWDSQREPAFPYPTKVRPWNERRFAHAIEDEDEAKAIALVRGALTEGLTWLELEHTFAKAALRHYLDFGHAAIYVAKTGELIEQLGREVMEPVLLALTRGLCRAFREDLIPEFRDYSACRANWGSTANTCPDVNDFESLGADRAMALAASSQQSPEELFHVLFEVSCRSFLRYDLDCQNRVDSPVSHNRTWLSFTHEITFANAVRQLATRHPELWPDALLQMCCFFGRNSTFLDRTVDMEDWRVDEPMQFLNDTFDGLYDHGRTEFIVAAHLIKTVTAISNEVSNAPDAPWVPTLLAALNRFLHSPLKRRYPLRAVTQAMSVVALED